MNESELKALISDLEILRANAVRMIRPVSELQEMTEKIGEYQTQLVELGKDECVGRSSGWLHNGGQVSRGVIIPIGDAGRG